MFSVAEGSHRIQLDDAHAYIMRAGQNADVVLVVTNLELVELLPSKFGAGRSNQEPYIDIYLYFRYSLDAKENTALSSKG